jgi:hypothetical protein
MDWYDLDAIRDNLSGRYLLMNDLDSTTAGYEELASPTANQGKGWQPVGTSYDDSFTGTFDGQGYEISDLFINRTDKGMKGIGLFGYVDEGGAIKNLGVVNADVTGFRSVGGLVGSNDGTVSNSYSSGNVTGLWFVGGLLGSNYGHWILCEVTVSDSYSSSKVTGEGAVGGLVGDNMYGIVSKCYSTGNVSANQYPDVGGLVGRNDRGTVIDSHSTGSVTGNSSVGGLVGENDEGIVSNSYSSGNVSGNSSVGGLVGWNRGTVSNSYSTGHVTRRPPVCGLVGDNYDGTVTDSFWDTETSGQSYSLGGTGKTTAEMQDIATFSGAGWSITAVANPGTRNPSYTWNIVNGVTYPFLSWQS